VLHWEQNHFTVLYKASSKRFHIADPEKGASLTAVRNLKTDGFHPIPQQKRKAFRKG
jgi:ABC-type bacteriocin/lantibiotic exporter with double-glycine peptidase domain